jgi:hypothetical protein
MDAPWRLPDVSEDPWHFPDVLDTP